MTRFKHELIPYRNRNILAKGRFVRPEVRLISIPYSPLHVRRHPLRVALQAALCMGSMRGLSQLT